MASNLGMKILAEMESGKAVQGLKEISDGIRAVGTAAAQTSKNTDNMEASLRTLVALGIQQRNAADAAAALAQQMAKVREAAREAAAAKKLATLQATNLAVALNHTSTQLVHVGMGMARVSGAAAAFMTDAFEKAKHFNEETNEFSIMFGRGAEAADKWSRDLGQAMGKGEAATRRTALKMQTLLAPLLGTDKATGITKELVPRIIDLASVKDMDPTQVAENFQSGLMGQVVPMKKFGAPPYVQEMQKFMDSLGMSGKFKDLSSGQKMELRAQFILEKTEYAIGDALKTRDAIANVLLEIQKRGEDISTKLGQAFVEMFGPAIRGVRDLMEWFDNLEPRTQRVVAVVLALTAGFTGLGGVLLVTLIPALTTLGTLLAAAAAAGTTLPALLSSTFASAAAAAAPFLVVAGSLLVILGSLGLIAGWIADMWGTGFFTAFDGTKQLFTDLIDWLALWAGRVLVVLMNPIQAYLTALSKALRFAGADGLADELDAIINERYKVSLGIKLDNSDLLSGIGKNPFQAAVKEMGENYAQALESAKRGWGNILEALGISNKDLLPTAKKGENLPGSEGGAGGKKLGDFEFTDADAANLYKEVEDERNARLKEEKEREKKAAEAAKKAADEAEKAAREVERYYKKFFKELEDFMQNLATRTLAFSKGDLEGAFGNLFGAVGQLIEATGVPLAGAIGSALDTVLNIITAPLKKVAGGLLGGETTQEAVPNILGGAMAGLLASSLIPVLGGLPGAMISQIYGPILMFAGVLVTLSTQTEEFARVSDMVNQGFKSLIEPLGAFWEYMYPVGGAFMELMAALGPTLTIFTSLAAALIPLDLLVGALVGMAEAVLWFISVMALLRISFTTFSVIAQLFSQLVTPIADFLFGLTGAIIGVQNLNTLVNMISWVNNVFVNLGRNLTSFNVTLLRAAAGLVDGLEAAFGIDIKGEGALKKAADKIEKAAKAIDDVSVASGAEAASGFLTAKNGTGAEQNINLPEAYRLAAGRAGALGGTGTDANGNPIDASRPTVNVNVFVNGIEVDAALEYADRTRDFRSLVTTGIVMPQMARGQATARRKNRN